jgi:hypothetical protein
MIPSVSKHDLQHGSKESGFVSAQSVLDDLPFSLSENTTKFHQNNNHRYSLEILNSYRRKLDVQLECFSGRESVKVSRDAQLHPWAAALFTDRNSLFAAPDVEQLRLPHQSSRTLMSRSEFVELKATFWLIALSLLFDVPSRNFSKKKLAHSRVRIVQLGLQRCN